MEWHCTAPGKSTQNAFIEKLASPAFGSFAAFEMSRSARRSLPRAPRPAQPSRTGAPTTIHPDRIQSSTTTRRMSSPSASGLPSGLPEAFTSTPGLSHQMDDDRVLGQINSYVTANYSYTLGAARTSVTQRQTSGDGTGLFMFRQKPSLTAIYRAGAARDSGSDVSSTSPGATIGSRARPTNVTMSFLVATVSALIVGTARNARK